jgi:hypothetical protein
MFQCFTLLTATFNHVYYCLDSQICIVSISYFLNN